MEIRNLDMIVHGRRYRTESATVIARQRFPGEKEGADAALATTLLFRTAKGNYFRQIQSHNAIIRDQIEPVNRDEAMKEYLSMPVQEMTVAEAFPGMNVEEA